MTCISIIPRIWIRTHIRLHRRFGGGEYWLTVHYLYLYIFSVPLTHLFSYHEISRMPTYGCRLQHKAYSCRRNFEWKRKRAFSERLYISCLPYMYNFSGSKYDFSFQLWKREIEKRTKMKTCINISFPSKVRFRKKVHSQASDHVWFFLNLFSKRPREKKEKMSIFRTAYVLL